MLALCNYARVLEFSYVVSFVEVRPKDIIDDLMVADFLKIASRAPYTRHVPVAKDLMQNAELLPLAEKLSERPMTVKPWAHLS